MRNMSVCLSVSVDLCVGEHISETTCLNFTELSVRVARDRVARSSSDTLCTSCFVVDGVIFSDSGPYGASRMQFHHDSTGGSTDMTLRRICTDWFTAAGDAAALTAGAEFDIYDWLVVVECRRRGRVGAGRTSVETTRRRTTRRG